MVAPWTPPNWKTGYFIVFHIFKLSVSMIFTSSSCVKLQEVIKKIPSFSKIFSTTPAYTSTTSSLPLIFMPLNEMASRVPLSNTMSYFPGFQSPLKMSACWKLMKLSTPVASAILLASLTLSSE